MEFIQLVGCDISSDLCILPDTIGDACSHVVLHPCIMSGSCTLLLRGIGYQRDWISYTERLEGVGMKL